MGDKGEHPLSLRDGDKANFKTILKAASNEDLCLISTTRKSDGAKVALVCAMGRDGDDYLPTPLAVMVEGNPYELFNDPMVDEVPA